MCQNENVENSFMFIKMLGHCIEAQASVCRRILNGSTLFCLCCFGYTMADDVITLQIYIHNVYYITHANGNTSKYTIVVVCSQACRMRNVLAILRYLCSPFSSPLKHDMLLMVFHFQSIMAIAITYILYLCLFPL